LIIDPEDEDQSFYKNCTWVIDDTSIKHADNVYAKNVEVTSNPYIDMELAMQRGADGMTVQAMVRKRVRDHDGAPIGVAHSNPLLDTCLYEVGYVDGHIEELTASVIAENIIAQVDEESRRQMMLSAIVDHCELHDTISKSQGNYVNSYNVKQRKTTTHGWELLVKWRDGSSDWLALKDLKQDSDPVELAIYAKECKVDDKPAFAWWVPYVLRKQKRVLQKIKTKYWARTHKYGICIPKNVKEAMEIDKEIMDGR
jgi:hypothetical protein